MKFSPVLPALLLALIRGHYLCNATCSMGRSSQGGFLSGGAGHKETNIERNGRHCTSSVAQVAPSN